MRAHFSSGGFTIIEVVIFLTVSSVLFGIGYRAFNGQQQRTQFNQGVQDLEQKIRDVANDVSTGYFPNNETFSCSYGLTGPIFSNSPQAQGANKECIFVGRVIHFGGSGDDTNLNIYTLAGNREEKLIDGTKVDVASIEASKPRVINGPSIDATEKYGTKYGIKITKVLVDNGDGTKTNIGALGFMNNFDGSGGLTVSGSSTTEIYRFPEPGVLFKASDAIPGIEAALRPVNASNTGLKNGVIVCLKSDTNGQDGAVVFGVNGSALATKSVFDQEARGLGC